VPSLEEYESHVERAIRRAIEVGAFDGLPGAGQPLAGLDGVHDPAWWARRYVDRERRRERGHEVAAEVERALGAVWRLEVESEVRIAVASLNERLIAANRVLPEADRLDLLDPDETIAVWHSMAGARRRS
jgi:hypothetical protein